MAKWFLKNYDFIHINSTVAGKYNKHKQDGSHLRFPIRMILATFDLHVTLMLPTKFGVNRPFSSGEQEKIDFQDGDHGFPIRKILATFDLQVTPMLPTKFRVNWHLRLGEEAKNRFSRWPAWRPSWIYDQQNFSYF